MGFLISLLLGFVPMLFYAAFVYWLDRYEKEPKLLLGGVFMWGVFVAGFGACFINTGFGVGIHLLTGSESLASSSTTSIIAPISEELLKGAAVAVVFLFFRKEFDSIMDGIVYGSVVGLGFAAIENTHYIYSMGFANGGWAGLALMAFIRVVLIGWIHACFTAFTGVGFAISRLSSNLFIKLGAPVIGLSLAVGAHSLHNTIGRVLGTGGLDGVGWALLSDIPGYCIILSLIAWSLWRERRMMRIYLADEVSAGLISAEQYRRAQSLLTQTLVIFQGRQVARFYYLLGKLAHKKNQLNRLGDEGRNQAIIAQLRREISSLNPARQVT